MEQLNLTNSTFMNSSDCGSIDDFRNQVYSTSYSLITVFGLVGNGFALAVLIKTSQQTSPFHVYMINLAVSDLLFVLTLPMRIIYYVRKGQWDYGDFLCRISSFSLYVNLYCSIYFMAAMSVTRFLAIVFPVQNMHLVTVSRARLACIVIWLLICVSSFPFLLKGQHDDHTTNKTKCFDAQPEGGDWQKLHKMNYVSMTLGFGLPFLVILICYAGIVHALLTRTNAARQHRDTGTKAIRMIVIVLLTFLVCFTPYHVQRTIHLNFMTRNDTTCAEKLRMQKSVVVTLSLAAANSCFDPMLYFFSGEAFRRRLSSIRLAMSNRGSAKTLKNQVGNQI